ncbi:MAG: hypothetical protein JRD49_15510, partial [Deltaproteobacteria bacterium]|nr:hypothetical protein [Deltaproteobacteria bacterium]
MIKKQDIKKLKTLIPHALRPDRMAARRTLKRLDENRGNAGDHEKQTRQLMELKSRLKASVAARHARI